MNLTDTKNQILSFVTADEERKARDQRIADIKAAMQRESDNKKRKPSGTETVELRENFKDYYLKQGKTSEEAEKMAEIATEGRTRSTGTLHIDLKESFRQAFLKQGKSPEMAEKMAEIAVRGR